MTSDLSDDDRDEKRDELVVAVEGAFGIRILPRTPDELVDAVEVRVESSDQPLPLRELAGEIAVDAFERTLAPAEHSLDEEVPFHRLFPFMKRPTLWKRYQRILDTDLPALESYGAVSLVTFLAAIGVGVAVAIGTSGFWGAFTAFLTAWGVLAAVTAPLKRVVPLPTPGDVAEHLVAVNPAFLKGGVKGWAREEVREVVRANLRRVYGRDDLRDDEKF